MLDFSKPPFNTTGCTGGTGITLGPDNQLANSCGLIINDQTGDVIANFRSEGGADEIWFNPSDDRYFLADRTPMHLGVARLLLERFACLAGWSSLSVGAM